MLEKETILSDHYLKPPYGGNGSERVKVSQNLFEANNVPRKAKLSYAASRTQRSYR